MTYVTYSKIFYETSTITSMSNMITNIGNQKVYCVANNSYIETEHKKLYPTQVLRF
jgi:hypothetical protein